jgi:predicted dehydrogenase
LITVEKQEKYKAAVIGTGRIGMLMEADEKRLKPATHFGMWSSHERFNLTAVCDNDLEKFKFANSMKQDVQCYDNPEQLIVEQSPDVVSISTWRDSHYDMMKLALKHRVPVIVCEKPIAEKKEHAEEVVAEARELGVHLLINHRRRFDPLLYPFKGDLKNGLIGEILQVNSNYVFGLLSTGTHLVDVLRMFLCDIAGEVEWVSAYPAPFKSFHPDDDPNIDGFLGFSNGLKVAIQSLSMKDYDIFDTVIYGRTGKAIFKNIGRDIEIYKVIESEEHSGFTELSNSPTELRGGEPRNQFGFLADNVVQCLEGTGNSLSTGEDSLIALEILLAMMESAEDDGRKVHIPQRKI